ncbi:MAG: oligosaccharide flippase family protein [Flavobacteriales bacterium]|nr:oligosaccharide flippase family protein [Flavobacteriales bacterium]
MKKTIRNIVKNALFKDYSITLIFSGVNAVLGFLMFKLVFHEFGEDGFFRFSILKRYIGFVLPIVILGLGVSLPKSISKNLQDDAGHKSFLLSAMFWSCVLPLVALGIFALIPETISQLFWNAHSEMDVSLSLAFFLYLLSLVMSAMNYGFYRGKSAFTLANFIEFINLSLIPIACIFLFSNLVDAMLAVAGALLIFNIILFVKIVDFNSFSKPSFRASSKELLAFGLPRLPGDIAYYFLMAAPAFVALKFYSLELSGIVSFGISLLAITQIILQPIGVISLSRAVDLIHSENKQQLINETWGTLKIMMGISILMLVVEIVFVDLFIELYFDKSFLKYTFIFRYMLLAVPALTLFYSLRGVLDAFYHKPVMGNIATGASIFFILSSVVIYFLGYSITATVIAYVVSLYILGGLCFIYTLKAFKK